MAKKSTAGTVGRARGPASAKPVSGSTASAAPVLVVGIGASAGGLGPIRKLLPQLEPGCGLAVVIVQHIGPGGDAMLASLGQDETRLTVLEAADGMPLLADHIYVMPARGRLSMLNDKFSVQDASQCQGLRMPIDHFLCTLAADQGRRSIGIILSGTGKDGTQGLAEIKAVGGATAVQDPKTAEFPEMPASAIAAGHADAVLAPENMGAFLTESLADIARQTTEQEDVAGLETVLAALRNAIGHDFHCYKRPTLARRTRRRMALHQVDSYEKYARMIRTNKEEAAALRKDLLIGVTEFFRQGEAWRVLEGTAIADVIARAQPGSTLRVWVPACSIGKEAYSVAMLMVENIERSGKKLALQVFATDADASAVEIARTGVYAEEDLKGLSQERLERFCTRRNGRYEVVKELRSVIVFAPQDLMADPPFSKLDLISCRNLLIYLDQTVQKKIIQLFHFALRDGGYLFLGSAETICGQDNLFEPVSQKWRMYRKLGVTTPLGLDLPLRPASKPAVSVPPAVPRTRLTLPSIAQQALAERYAPAAAVVDRKGALLYTHGNVGDFLEVPVGETTGLLADAAREGLRNRLAGALTQAVTENKKIAIQARVRKDKKSVPVKITVSPMRHPREADGLLLVTFEALRLPKAAPVTAEGASPHSDMRQLEDELKITREELSSTIEQFGQSNENLKASHEEVTAANEELQSANEELETSKEELQSLNEELNAVNQRLQEKVVELEQSSNDVSNLLTSGSIATVFLDKELKVRRFTQAITKLLGLVETDMGRPIADIHRKFQDETLLSDARRVLVDLAPATAEVRAEDGAWYDRRILPYRTKDDRIEGVVITFNEVTDLKELADALRCSEESVRQSEANYRELVQNANCAIVRWTCDGTITFFNEYAQSFFGYSADEVIGRHVSLLVPQQDSAGADLTSLVKDIVASPEKYVNNVNENIRRDGRRVWMAWTNRPILGPSGKVAEILAIGMDITERKRAEEALRASEAKYRNLFENMTEEVHFWKLVRDEKGEIKTWEVVDVNPPALRSWGRKSREDTIGRLADEIYAGATQHYMPVVRKIMTEGVPYSFDDYLPSADKYFRFTSIPLGEYFITTGADITSIKKAELAVRESEQQFKVLIENLQSAVALINEHGAFTIVNRSFLRLFELPEDAGILNVNNRDWSQWQVFDGNGVLLDVDEHPVRQASLTGRPVKNQLVAVQAPGTAVRKWILVSAEPILDTQGRLHRLICTYYDITARKQAEDALRASEHRYRMLFDSLQEGFYLSQIIFDEDGKPVDFTYLDVNPAFERIMGRPRDQIVGHRAKELIPALKPGWAAVFGKVQLTGEPTRYDTYSDYFKKHFEAFVFRPAPGQFAVLVTDVTDRKRAEEELYRHRQHLEELIQERTAALRTSEQEFRSLAEAMPQIVWATRSDGWNIYFNHQWVDYTGMTMEESYGHGWNKPFHPDDQQRAWEAWQRATQHNEPYSLECRLRRADGSYRWWLIRGSPMRGANGGILKWFGTCTDIEEIKRAEAALQEANDLLEQRVAARTVELKTVMDVAPVAIWVSRDPECHEISGNSTADRFYEAHEGENVSAGPSTGQPVPPRRFFRDGRELTAAELPMQEAAAKGVVVPAAELEVDLPSGRRITMYGGASPLLDTHGKVCGCVGAFVDITDRRRSEDALRKVADELARSNKDLESFAHVASHDLQEPLRMVTAFIGLLKDRYQAQLDAKGQEYLGYAIEGSTRMSVMVRDLLTYARVSARSKQSGPVDLDKAVHEAMTNLHAAITESDALVTIDPLPTVSADFIHMQQLFQNLLGNAIKFRVKGRRPEVHVAVRREGDAWLFQVSDNGIGIPREYQHQLFGVFQRLHTREEYPGTGIGLATCKSIVERLGGRIWVESEPDKGSTFCFTIPAATTA